MTSNRSYIEQQLNEIELLRCCYPSSDEFRLDDIEAFNEAKQFINEKLDHFQRNLGFIIKIHLNEINVKISQPFFQNIKKNFFLFSRQILNYNLFIRYIILTFQLIFIYVLIYHGNVMRNLMNL